MEYQKYPSLIYNNEAGVCVTVENEYQKKCLEGYFKDELDHDKLPYTEIALGEAMKAHSDSKAEAEYKADKAPKDSDNPSVDMDALRAEIKAELLAEMKTEGSPKDPETVEPDPDADIKTEGNGPVPELKDTTKLGWNELRAYGKELEDSLGVDLPLGATRDIVEKSINEVLNGDNYKRRSQESVS